MAGTGSEYGVKAVSLFSGVGGLDIGLHQAGVETVACIEQDGFAAKSLKINSARYDSVPDEPHIAVSKQYPWAVINQDIRTVTANKILDVADVERASIDIVVGGPPCQTFSRSNEGNRAGTETDRGKLYREYARLLHEIQPSAFIFENVRGLKSSNGGEDLEKITSLLEGDVYNTDTRVLNAADYGIPQTRKRLFILGTRDNGTLTFPEPTHSEFAENGAQEWVPAGDALRNFTVDRCIEKDYGGYKNAIGSKYGPLLREIPKGANYQHFSDRKYDPEEQEYVARSDSELDKKHFDWRSRHWNYLLKTDPGRPCWTIQADPGSTVGPFHWRGRKLSLLEQMALMDLPLDYYIAGPPNAIQTQIGNAVPPGLAKAVVQSLVSSIGEETGRTHTDNAKASTDTTVSPTTQAPLTVEVTTQDSPYHNADRVLQTLVADEAVLVRAEGRAIPYAIDAVDIARRHIDQQLELDVEETVKYNDTLNGGCTSCLQVTVLTRDLELAPQHAKAK